MFLKNNFYNRFVQMADPTTNAVRILVDFGLFDVILPFVFIFTIVFATLQKSGVLGTFEGKPKANVNAMVAFVVGFIFVASLRSVNIMTGVLQKLAVVLVAVVMVLMIAGMFGLKGGVENKKWYFVLFFIVITIFVTTLGWFKSSYIDLVIKWLFHPIAIALYVFVGVVIFIVGKPGETLNSKPASSSKKKLSKPKSSDSSLVKELDENQLYGGDEGQVHWKE